MCISAQSRHFLRNSAENAANYKLCDYALKSHFVRIMMPDCAAHKTEVRKHDRFILVIWIPSRIIEVCSRFQK